MDGSIRLTGARDIILDGQTGLLVAQRSPQELAEKISLLMNDSKLRQDLGENGRRHVKEHYDWQVVSSAFLTEFAAASEVG